MGFENFLANLGLGISTAFSLKALSYCFLGVVVGNFVGVLPGVGALATIAMLIPLTFGLDATTAIIMLAGIYYGAAYGGATTSILLNLPGEAQTAVTCLDGYPMTKEGRGGIALFMATIASFVGSLIGLLILALFSPPLALIGTKFSAEEYFALMILGLLAASLLSSGSPFRSLIMVTFGLILGLTGADVTSGEVRFTLGFLELYNGLPLVAIGLGIFGLPEVISDANQPRARSVTVKDITFRSMIPSRDDWRRSWRAILRGSAVGSFFGTLPGTGGVIASFMSYALEKRVHKDPAAFGKGAIEGVAGPEAANNAAVQTSFIPTLTLGLPKDAVMALILGVLMIHGVAPGPKLIGENPAMFWGLVVSFAIGNIMLVVLNIPLIGIWVRLITIPYSILYPAIVVFVCIGVYAVNYAVSDLVVLMVFTLIGYGMLLLKFEPAPMILGFILGPLMEENLRRSLVLSDGNPATFVQRPLSMTLLVLSVALVGWVIYKELKSKHLSRRSGDLT